MSVTRPSPSKRHCPTPEALGESNIIQRSKTTCIPRLRNGRCPELDDCQQLSEIVVESPQRHVVPLSLSTESSSSTQSLLLTTDADIIHTISDSDAGTDSSLNSDVTLSTHVLPNSTESDEKLDESDPVATNSDRCPAYRGHFTIEMPEKESTSTRPIELLATTNKLEDVDDGNSSVSRVARNVPDAVVAEKHPNTVNLATTLSTNSLQAVSCKLESPRDVEPNRQLYLAAPTPQTSVPSITNEFASARTAPVRHGSGRQYGSTRAAKRSSGGTQSLRSFFESGGRDYCEFLRSVNSDDRSGCTSVSSMLTMPVTTVETIATSSSATSTNNTWLCTTPSSVATVHKPDPHAIRQTRREKSTFTSSTGSTLSPGRPPPPDYDECLRDHTARPRAADLSARSSSIGVGECNLVAASRTSSRPTPAAHLRHYVEIRPYPSDYRSSNGSDVSTGRTWNLKYADHSIAAGRKQPNQTKKSIDLATHLSSSTFDFATRGKLDTADGNSSEKFSSRSVKPAPRFVNDRTLSRRSSRMQTEPTAVDHHGRRDSDAAQLVAVVRQPYSVSSERWSLSPTSVIGQKSHTASMTNDCSEKRGIKFSEHELKPRLSYNGFNRGGWHRHGPEQTIDRCAAEADDDDYSHRLPTMLADLTADEVSTTSTASRLVTGALKPDTIDGHPIYEFSDCEVIDLSITKVAVGSEDPHPVINYGSDPRTKCDNEVEQFNRMLEAAGVVGSRRTWQNKSTANNLTTLTAAKLVPTTNVALLQWTVEEVSLFVSQIPGCRDYAEAFVREEVDGVVLAHVTEDHLLNVIKMRLGPMLRLRIAIDLLLREPGGH